MDALMDAMDGCYGWMDAMEGLPAVDRMSQNYYRRNNGER